MVDLAQHSRGNFLVFFPSKKEGQQTTPVPDGSLAALGLQSSTTEMTHPAGVWSGHEAVLESIVHSEYHDMSISLLVFPAHGSGRLHDGAEEQPGLMDTYEAFQR